jgi:hypothetical protein
LASQPPDPTDPAEPATPDSAREDEPRFLSGGHRILNPAEIQRILADVETEPLEYIDETTDLARRERETDLRLKQWYANWLLKGLAAQIFIVNLFFLLYASIGVGWNVPQAVISVWFSATVVEVVGVVAIVTRHLFPRRDNQ